MPRNVNEEDPLHLTGEEDPRMLRALMAGPEALEKLQIQMTEEATARAENDAQIAMMAARDAEHQLNRGQAGDMDREEDQARAEWLNRIRARNERLRRDRREPARLRHLGNE